MGRLIIGDHTGHQQLDWKKSKASIQAAQDLFNETLKKGYFAAVYHGDSRNPQNGKISRKFDETATEIKMMPNLQGG